MKTGIAFVRHIGDYPEFAFQPDRGCADIDPDIFFPDRYSIEQTRPAKAVCRACPYLQECGVWAIQTEQEHGIWGSLTPKERGDIREKLTSDGS